MRVMSEVISGLGSEFRVKRFMLYLRLGFHYEHREKYMDTILSHRAALLNLFTCSSANTLNHVGKINSYLRFIISVQPVAGL